MSYVAIDAAEIDVADPLSQELLQKIKDNFDFLRSVAPDVVITDVQNGGFELDADADGIADNWEETLLTNGACELDTTDPYQGAQCVKMTRTAVSGNGGAQYDSGYIEISEFLSPLVEFALKCSAAGIIVTVTGRYFDADQVHISDETIYTSTANPTSWTMITAYGVPPATAKYMKLRLTGGEVPGGGAAGTGGDVRFDAVHVDPYPSRISMSATIAEGHTSSGAWGNIGSLSIVVPKGFHQARAIVNGYVTPDSEGFARFRISTATSGSLFIGTATMSVTGCMEADITGISGTQTFYLDAYGNQCFVSMTANSIEFLRGKV